MSLSIDFRDVLLIIIIILLLALNYDKYVLEPNRSNNAIINSGSNNQNHISWLDTSHYSPQIQGKIAIKNVGDKVMMAPKNIQQPIGDTMSTIEILNYSGIATLLPWSGVSVPDGWHLYLPLKHKFVVKDGKYLYAYIEKN